MTLDTDVQKLKTVEDESGNDQSPANETEQKAIRDRFDRLGNWGALHAEEITDDTTGSTFTAHAIPDGVEVLVGAPSGNGGPISIGPAGGPYAAELSPGAAISVQVTDASLIGMQASSGGDAAYILAEDSA